MIDVNEFVRCGWCRDLFPEECVRHSSDLDLYFCARCDAIDAEKVYRNTFEGASRSATVALTDATRIKDLLDWLVIRRRNRIMFGIGVAIWMTLLAILQAYGA